MGVRNAVVGVADACGTPPLGPYVEISMGHAPPCWVWQMHVVPSPGAAGGVPNGDTKRCTGCGRRM
eukprot:4510776-Pyramimonas_sp.AAC.1